MTERKIEPWPKDRASLMAASAIRTIRDHADQGRHGWAAMKGDGMVYALLEHGHPKHANELMLLMRNELPAGAVAKETEWVAEESEDQ